MSRRDYHELSLAIDHNATAHVATVLGGSIFHLTNAGGRWTGERITSPPGPPEDGEDGFVDREPSIAIDTDGSVWVAFTRMWDYEAFGAVYPEGMYLVTNSSGSWSTPLRLAGDAANRPSLAVRDGRVHVAYVDGRLFDAYDPSVRLAVMYGTDHGGSFATTRVARHGDNPQLELDSEGRPHVLYQAGRSVGSPTGLDYGVADASGGPFTVEKLPGTSGDDFYLALALDSVGVPHATWTGGSSVRYASRRGGSWSDPEAILTGAYAPAMSVDSAGAVHVAAMGSRDGVLYASSRGGSFSSRLLASESGDFNDAVDVAVDRNGRPNVVFTVHGYNDEANTRLWYAVGPAD